jgi:hypothetical protein
MTQRITMDGTLTMHSALIDWRDDSARCVALFKSSQGPALEVEYRVVLNDHLLKILATAFVVAGVPMLRAPEVPVSLAATPHGENGNGNGHHKISVGSETIKRESTQKCELCGVSLYGKAIPIGYCRICRTTRATEIAERETTHATP